MPTVLLVVACLALFFAVLTIIRRPPEERGFVDVALLVLCIYCLLQQLPIGNAGRG